jgi:hypothetical protein
MFVRLGTSFRGRPPFRILDIFCQPRCISHLYSKVAKSTACTVCEYGISPITCVLGYDSGGAGLLFAFFF